MKEISRTFSEAGAPGEFHQAAGGHLLASGAVQRRQTFADARADSRGAVEKFGERTMKLGLEGKVTFITGGSKGIGLACARAFAGEGARVAIASRGQENLDKARQALAGESVKVVTARADFSNPDDARAAAASVENQLGPIDILINCAGAANRYQVEAYNEASWQQGMSSKYFPQVHAMDAVRKGMIERKSGTIVNIIGMGGKSAQQVFLSGGAANAALMLVTAGWASALGRYGIRVNGINPGSTLTDRVQRGMQADAQAQGITEAEALAPPSRGFPSDGLLARKKLQPSLCFSHRIRQVM
jgi:NAD(P)-dependent dehydrogenase (short-subunit alcohol dehydrogenase family)